MTPRHLVQVKGKVSQKISKFAKRYFQMVPKINRQSPKVDCDFSLLCKALKQSEHKLILKSTLHTNVKYW